MNGNVMEFKKRFSELTKRHELLKMEEEVKEFRVSETFKMILDEEKDALDDLLMEVIRKKEYFHSGCNPRKVKH